jgi:uncharacterized protein YkwD
MRWKMNGNIKNKIKKILATAVSSMMLLSVQPVSFAFAIDSETEAESAMQQINDYRVSNGLPELIVSDSLTQLATVRCSEVNKLLSHYRTDSTYFSSIFTEYAIDVSNVGESISSGNSELDTADKLVEKWISSDEDNKTILDTKYKYAGLAVTENNNSTYKYNWVLILAGDSTLLLADSNNPATGDVNGDGKVNSSDAVIVLSTYAKQLTGQIKKTTDAFTKRSDVNADSKINSLDAVWILKYFASSIISKDIGTIEEYING